MHPVRTLGNLARVVLGRLESAKVIMESVLDRALNPMSPGQETSC